jgi:hypothetical protein
VVVVLMWSMVKGTLLVTGMLPGVTTAVPFMAEKFARKVALPPTAMPIGVPGGVAVNTAPAKVPVVNIEMPGAGFW